MRAAFLASYNATFIIKVKRPPVVGETVKAYGMRVEHGGKGSNQAIGLRRLGDEVSVIAGVGNDSFGRAAVEKWIAEGVGVEHVVERGATGMAFVFVLEDGSNMIAISPNANEELDIRHVEDAFSAINADAFAAVLEVSPDVALEALRLEAKSGVKTFLNPAPAVPIPPESLEGITAITPNETELKIMAGLSPDSPADVEQILLSYARHVEVAAVTLGERGCVVAYMGEVKRVPAYRVKAVDTTGAGDAWNAAFIHYYMAGLDPFESAAMANAAAAYLVSRQSGKEDLVENLPTEIDLELFIKERLSYHN